MILSVVTNSNKSQVLENSGIKKTTARLAIFNFLKAKQKPADVLEIIDYLKKNRVDADKVTIYRILDLFLEKKLVNRLEFQEGKFRYEISEGHHHHLICINCKTVEDIDIKNDVTKHEKFIKESKNFKVLNHSLEFFGLCKNCQ